SSRFRSGVTRPKRSDPDARVPANRTTQHRSQHWRRDTRPLPKAAQGRLCREDGRTAGRGAARLNGVTLSQNRAKSKQGRILLRSGAVARLVGKVFLELARFALELRRVGGGRAL